MRLFTAAFFMSLIVSSNSLHAMPAGTWVGSGNMIILKNGERMRYPVSYAIDDAKKTVIAKYGADEGGFSLKFEYKHAARQMVEFFVEGRPGGTGYCMVSSCHFDLDFSDPEMGQNRISSTFTWNKDQLIVNGHSFTDEFIYEDILARPRK